MSIENLDAGAEGGEKTAEGWKYEEQICAGRWLLEEFQERVLRLRRDAVGLADDEDLSAATDGRVADPVDDEMAQYVDADVQSLTFTYFDKAGSTLTDAGVAGVCDTIPTSIWRIQINLQVKVGDETVDLRSEVNPGNFT